MKTIFFKKYLIEMIKKGLKTQTIRKWKKCYLEPGDIVSCNFKQPFLYIDNIYQKPLKNLSQDELLQQGYTSFEEFRKTWIDCYNSFDSSQQVFVIRFHLYTPNSS